MFKVRVADNFRYMDEDEVYTHGEFATWAEALAASQRIVERSLLEFLKPGMSAAELFSQYAMFGDDPFIVPTAEGEKLFSARDHARQRCEALCGAGCADPS